MHGMMDSLASRYVLLDRVPVRSRGRLRRHRLAAALYLCFPILIGAACIVDGTWTMASPAKGFSQHYGFWAIFVTTPAILLLTSRLLHQFVERISDIDAYCISMDANIRRTIGVLVERHVQSLRLRSRSATILVMLMLGLIFWCILNILNTITPQNTYHHDVFDAYAHPYGFYVTKVYVFLVFAIVYAIALFVSLHVTISLISVMRFVRNHGVARVDFFHADNCGGMSRFGNVNLLILAIYLNFFIVIYAMYLTHRAAYLVMLASLIASSALAITQSVVAVYYIHKAIGEKKSDCLAAVVKRLNDVVSLTMPPRNAFPGDLLALRNHIAGVHTFPYAQGAAAAVNIIRFAPAAIAVLGLFVKWPPL